MIEFAAMDDSKHAPRCLVLGGSGHVGSAVCRALAGEGARLSFTYHSREAAARDLERALPGSRALRADLRDFAAAANVVDEAARILGGLDVLIQCAGTAGDPALYKGRARDGCDKFQGIDAAGYAVMMSVTVQSTFAASQAAARIMRAGGGGQIVIVGSMDGVKTMPTPIHYAAAKGALRAMAQALAKELGKHGVRVNMIAPGILEGGIAGLLSKDLLDDYLAHCALKRLGTADEVAQAVSWFATQNTYVTGQSVVLDGGL